MFQMGNRRHVNIVKEPTFIQPLLFQRVEASAAGACTNSDRRRRLSGAGVGDYKDCTCRGVSVWTVVTRCCI